MYVFWQRWQASDLPKHRLVGGVTLCPLLRVCPSDAAIMLDHNGKERRSGKVEEASVFIQAFLLTPLSTNPQPWGPVLSRLVAMWSRKQDKSRWTCRNLGYAMY